MSHDRTTTHRQLLDAINEARDTVATLRATWEQNDAEIRDIARRVTALEDDEPTHADLSNICPDFPPADLTGPMSSLDDIHRHLLRTRDSLIRGSALRDREDAALADLERRLAALEDGETYDSPTLAELVDRPCPDHPPEAA